MRCRIFSEEVRLRIAQHSVQPQGAVGDQINRVPGLVALLANSAGSFADVVRAIFMAQMITESDDALRQVYARRKATGGVTPRQPK
jgi:hypothetical protein